MKTPLIDIQNVSLRFTNQESFVLREINYKIFSEDFIVVLGSNGSGKSSLLKLINKTLKPVSGKILISEKILRHTAPKDFNPQIKILTQNCHESLFVSLSLLENYILIKQFHEPKLFSLSYKSEREFLSRYLQNFNGKLSAKLDQTVQYFSGGEKQALALALTMLYPPKILLLDEHTSALDPRSAEKLMVLTKKNVIKFKITCLFTTHDPLQAKNYGNRILALKGGVLHQDIDLKQKSRLSLPEILDSCY